MAITTGTIRTKIPARMDRLPWSQWHWLIVWALGAVWILDGLEVTMKGAVGSRLTNPNALGLTAAEVGLSASIYIGGAISGSLFWGYLTDRFGRRKLFMLTLALYMAGVLLTGLSWNFASFVTFRFITGFAIGGEYSAINSAIDELIPARARGWVDLAINGSYWIGTIVAASLSLLYLDTNIFPVDLGWRIAFFTGLVLAFGLLLLRRHVPESPRWLMTHGQPEEAERVVRQIERDVSSSVAEELSEPSDDDVIEIRERDSVGFVEIARTAFKVYPKRTILGLSLMGTQAFLYNAIFFTYGLVLTSFYGVSEARVGLYLIPFAVGNFLGPLLLGRFFDTVGRKPMISMSYIVSGALLIVVGYLFTTDVLTTVTLTASWVVVFFFASAGASAGYLTVSETFPMEIRAMAIAFFYSIATGIGGIIGPLLFGSLIGTGNSRSAVYVGYLIGAGLMIFGGVTELLIGVKAEQQGLESIAKPLSAASADDAGDQTTIEGPLGLDLADDRAIRQFQKQNGLDETGVIDAATRGALAARIATSDDDEDENGEVLGVDFTDATSIAEFQDRHGLTADGVVGPATRGALIAQQGRIELDPSRADSIRQFQAAYGLREDGVIGPRTQAALRAVAAERIHEFASADTDEGDEDSDPARSAMSASDVDVTDADSVKAFQRLMGLAPSGDVDGETQGALSAAWNSLEVRLGLDVSDPASVATFQALHELEPDGIVGATTREVIAALAGQCDARPVRRAGINPSDPDEIQRFQSDHGLDATGVIDEETGRAIRREEHRTVGVDAADRESIASFQHAHGLDPDGIIGPETMGAMLAARGRATDRRGRRRPLRRPRARPRPDRQRVGAAVPARPPPHRGRRGGRANASRIAGRPDRTRAPGRSERTVSESPSRREQRPCGGSPAPCPPSRCDLLRTAHVRAPRRS